MKTKTFWLLNTLALLSLLLSNCTGVTPIPVTPVIRVTSTTEPTLTIKIQKDKVGPSVVGQQPIDGERLTLESGIQIVFDRDMNQQKTADAFTLLDSDNKPVRGKINWLDPQTFSFIPDSKLQPSSAYQGIFSTDAAGADGLSLQD